MTQTYAGPARVAGVVLILAAVGAMALLAIHPAEGGASFAEVLRNEAAGRAVSGLVHGGFAALLALQLMALSVLALSARRPPSVAGTVLFGLGVVALSLSLITDGLVIPAIAAKYADAPAKIEFAKSLFVLCGSYIAVLMPAGLVLQSGGVVVWGIGLAHDGRTRLGGIFGILTGLAGGVSVGVLGLNMFAVMGAIAGLEIWLITLGVTAARGKLGN